MISETRQKLLPKKQYTDRPGVETDMHFGVTRVVMMNDDIAMLASEHIRFSPISDQVQSSP